MYRFIILFLFCLVINPFPHKMVHANQFIKDCLSKSFENFCKKERFHSKPHKKRKTIKTISCLAILSAYTEQQYQYDSNDYINFDQISGSVDPYHAIQFTPGDDHFIFNQNGDYLIRLNGVAHGHHIKTIISTFNECYDFPSSLILSLPAEGIIKITNAPQTVKIKLSSESDSIILENGCSITIQQMSQF